MTKASRLPIAILIGGGSKLPVILKASKKPKSKFYISLVVSHKKDSEGIRLSLKNNIPAAYFNLPDFRQRFDNTRRSRSIFMKYLGWFISQKQFAPKLLVFAGWNLVVDKNFLSFFKCNFGDGYAAINLHPALLPTESEDKKIKLPDRTSTPIIKGEQNEVLKAVLDKNVTYFGPTVHFMIPSDFDTGRVINREFIKVGKAKTIDALRKKLLPIEDKILIDAIDQVLIKYLQ